LFRDRPCSAIGYLANILEEGVCKLCQQVSLRDLSEAISQLTNTVQTNFLSVRPMKHVPDLLLALEIGNGGRAVLPCKIIFIRAINGLKISKNFSLSVFRNQSTGENTATHAMFMAAC
jgi:hypothetical protein